MQPPARRLGWARQGREAKIRVVFHIGSAKTGTTAIQQFFHRNRRALLEQGLLYPKMLDGKKHHKLLSVPFDETVQRGTPFGADYPAAVENARAAWAGVRRQIANKRPDTVLISSEFLLMATHVERIADFVAPYVGSDAALEFLVYLRPPSDWYVSAMQQWFKASANLLPLEPPPVLAQLDRFAALGKVTARRFDRTGFRDGSVISDICDLLGVDGAPLDHAAEDANVSISAEGIILLQAYRRQHHAAAEAVFTPDTREYIEKIAAEEAAHPGLYTKPRLKPDLARALDRETPDLRALRLRYGVALARGRSLPFGLGARAGRIGPFTEAAEVIVHDSALVDRLRRAVD